MELAKGINADLYPDVATAGNLANALDQALTDVGSPLQAQATDMINFIPYALTARGSRSCQLYIASPERLFIFDFWTKGVAYGKGASSSLSDVAQAMHFWIVEEPDIARMKDRFSFFIPDEGAIAHEAGHAVEYQWEKLRQRWSVSDAMSPLPMIEAAMKQPALRQLFPFTSLYTLRFSRTTGYPFTHDCPFAAPIGNGRFRVYRGSPPMSYGDPDQMKELIGEGNAEEAVAMLVAHLPPNCGAAVDGTADEH